MAAMKKKTASTAPISVNDKAKPSLKTKKSSSMQTLHALIVAVDKYPIPAHQLNGCVNDASAFADYLKSYCAKQGITYNEKRLFDADAKRLEIIKNFDMFEAAQNNDICVYYYSGHGSQMPAPKEFWDEPDGMSQTIVCYDSRTGGSNRDMADKEIGYLIHKATKGKDVHFLAVTDCCHSGSNTRELDVLPRMADTCPTTAKGVDDYLGFKSYVNFQPPSAKHIHLAAAKNNETAKELKINGVSRGVFTYSLIETLEQMNGNISYGELISRVKLKARNRVIEQTPQLNAYVATGDVKLTFLGNSEAKSGNFVVSFDKVEGWIVNAGGVQGIPTEGGAIFKLENGIEVTTTKVLANHSKINGIELLSQDKQFRAVLNGLNMPPVLMAMSKDSETSGATILKKKWAEMGIEGVKLVDDEAQANYIIRAWDGAYRLTKRDNTSPLFKRVVGYDAENAKDFLNRCDAVAHWQERLELVNPSTTIKDAEIDIQFCDNGSKPMAEPIYRQANDTVAADMQLSITNRGSRPYWVSAVWFGADFSVDNQFLRQKFIKPNETAWLEYENGRTVPLMVQAEYLSWGVNELTEYFKIFVSTDAIDTDLHNQEGLPLDERTAQTNRGIPKPVPMQDWRTFERAYTVICPMKSVNIAGSKGNRELSSLLEIVPPFGFSAQIALSSTGEVKRGLNDELPRLMAGNDFISASLEAGMGIAPVLDVMELQNVVGNVTKSNPLKINILQKHADNEMLIPLGYDAETGLYLPLGNEDTEGVISIHTLLQPTATTRGIGDSFKIFFKKMIIRPTTGKYDYPLLRMINYGNSPEAFSYTHDTALLKQKIADPKIKRIALFVHGFIGSTSEQPKSLRRSVNTDGSNLTDSYDLVLSFDYESLNTPINQTSADLEKRLAEVGLIEGHGKQFDIIAHSMGGLVSRYFIEKLTGKNTVSHLIMLGTPNAGSEISGLYDGLTALLTMGINGLTSIQPWMSPLMLFLSIGVDKVFVTVKQQIPSSDFLQSLNSASDAGVPYRIIVGNTEKFKKADVETHSFMSKVTENLRTRRILAVADVFFGEPNDMVVKTLSIGSAGLQRNVKIEEVAASHFSYFVPVSESIQALAEVVRTFQNETNI